MESSGHHSRQRSGRAPAGWALATALGVAVAGCGPEDAGTVNLGKAKEVAAEKGLDRGAPPAEKKTTKVETKKGAPIGRGSNRGGN